MVAMGLLGALPCGFGESPRQTSSAVPAPVLFQRVVLLGASGTSGFDKSEPLGVPKTTQYRFAKFVEAACPGAREPVATQATHLLFLDPDTTMERQVTATVAAKPSLVLGLDALFWSCYGANLSPPQRIARFEDGLRRLEKITAPLVVADIPDATSAIGAILSRAQVPNPAVIAQCNQRLQEWVRGCSNVAVFPLARLMSAAQKGEEVSIAGFTSPAGESASLVRPDRLHPSLRGLAALAITMLDTAAAAFAPEAATGLNRDLESILASATGQAGIVPGNR